MFKSFFALVAAYINSGKYSRAPKV